MSKASGIGACLAIIALAVVLLGVGGLVLMLVWNAVVPIIFGLPPLEYIQALALWVLISMIGGTFQSKSRKD